MDLVEPGLAHQGLSSPTLGARGSTFIAVPGPTKVDVLDAADELARVAEPGLLQVLVQLEARTLHDLGESATASAG